MKKLTKMLIIPCATLAIVAAGGAIVSFADPTETVSVQSSVASASDAWKYRTYRDGVTISKYLGTDNDVVIPNEIDGKPVTRLDGGLFEGKAITSVEMPDTIIDIGYNVFEDCDKLTDVKLSNSIKELPDGAFRGCRSLEKIKLPEALEKFSTSAFTFTILKELYIPKNVREITFGTVMPDIIEYTVDEDNPYFSSQDGMLLNKSGDTLYLYPKGRVEKYSYIKLPDNITTIKSLDELEAWNSVYYCYYFGDSITTIENTSYDYEEISIWTDENSEAYKRLNIENYENVHAISEQDFDTMASSDFWFIEGNEKGTLSAHSYIGTEDVANIPQNIGNMRVANIDAILFGGDISTVIIPETFKKMSVSGLGTRNYEWRIANNDKLVKIVNNSNLDIPVKVVNNKYKGWSRTENGSAGIVNMLPAKTTMYKIKNSSSGGNSGNSGSSSGSHHHSSSSSSDSSDSGEPATSNKKNTSSASVGLQITKSPFIMNSWEKVGNNWKFRMSDGSYATSQWICSNGKWYLIGKDGIMLTGWQLVNSKWYFMNQDGTLLTGWQFINGKWYYLTSDGSMLASAQTPDGYKVDANGAWIQ